MNTAEAQVNQEFIDAWHRAERNEIISQEEWLYVQESEMLKNFLTSFQSGLQQACREVKLQEAGKLPEQTLEEFLAEF